MNDKNSELEKIYTLAVEYQKNAKLNILNKQK